jgi:hypothetical protein
VVDIILGDGGELKGSEDTQGHSQNNQSRLDRIEIRMFDAIMIVILVIVKMKNIQYLGWC